MAAIPPTRSALVVSGPGQLDLVTQPMPEPGPGQVLVRVACVALNPSDAKMVNAGVPLGSVAGLDFAGVVVAVGPPAGSFPATNGQDDPPKEEHGRQITIGSRVCSLAFGYNKDGGLTGGFADYVLAEAHLLVPVPDGMALDETATLPVGLITGGMVLFHELGLDATERAMHDSDLAEEEEEEEKKKKDILDHQDRRTALVYGGSTASGLIMIQLLKQQVTNSAGFDPIAVCSPSNFQLVKSAGATAVFDYRAGPEDCAAEIRTHTRDRLQLAIDCITSPDSMRVCYGALRPAPSLSGRGRDDGAGLAVVGDSRYVALDSFPASGHTRRAVRPSWVFAMSGFGKPVDWTGPYRCEALPDHREFAARWMREVVPRLLEQGAVKPLARTRVLGRSLVDVRGGLRLLSEGRVSGEKLVCVLGA
ncbi:hypothetical protein PpBr36_02607 [Pyricularia pennisetigena]|uniref:hypothetical protein n=1 Tax=Pyricularia pennisetigena TaxID=1578925 RepID=UPI00114FEC24|nr:hypothetical protein PpBr36_02607 [Pyricularia pennisetigena]TLS31068.1 hypothetical protein PpBr36_02607 [Pyricularia pennisetigena]